MKEDDTKAPGRRGGQNGGQELFFQKEGGRVCTSEEGEGEGHLNRHKGGTAAAEKSQGELMCESSSPLEQKKKQDNGADLSELWA